MTAAFDDTVDILHVVHDKALMKDTIAARTFSASRAVQEESFIPTHSSTKWQQEGALSDTSDYHTCHSSSEASGKSARSRSSDRQYGATAGPTIVDQTSVRSLSPTAALLLPPFQVTAALMIK